MNKYLVSFLGALLALATTVALILYGGEVRNNAILRRENLKTADEAQKELQQLKEETKKERDKSYEEKQSLMSQIGQLSKEREAALVDRDKIKKEASLERENSKTTNEDLNKLRQEVAQLRKERKESVTSLEEGFKKKMQAYDARILSLEEALDKAKNRLASEADRYHYNLGVVYTQNKDYDLAVTEFKDALGYNPKNALAHYNLGIIFDDYFKDKENARYHYRTFLDLQPTSDDAEAVREWLANLDKSHK